MTITRKPFLPTVWVSFVLISLGIITALYPLSFIYGIEVYSLSAIAWFAYRRSMYNTAFAVAMAGAASGIFLMGHRGSRSQLHYRVISKANKSMHPGAEPIHQETLQESSFLIRS
ncbi:hypothetical protein B2K_10165 [Paenibacillus mucilaginosus K02]|uniref:Uncharacterized protein n=1 Tax=Paenibacillus mucilaginosus K02 TaxID=997761 RepID=I0BFD6_9BACL|nr:hypothetical protein B2K_10165 [Paenibacillus mucilaginosus K02]